MATNDTWVYYWDERLRTFTLAQAITTHSTTARDGGATVFNNDIYIGKYREVYGEPGTVFAQLRRHHHSLPLMEVGSKDKLGTEYSEDVAPIDTRAPGRFYRGRIKTLSSLTRALDDRTGLFKIADMNMSLANNDKRYSTLLATRIFGGQLVKLYHCWSGEPEALRQLIMTFMIDDHELRGTHFNLKLKDITQNYFEAKVPNTICTLDDYPDIHADSIGRYMPEVLGDVQMTTGEQKGAVKAVYISDAEAGPWQWRYLASRGKLHGIDAVYTNDAVLPGANWRFVAGPPSLIETNLDQGDNAITFDCQGYSWGAWDDPTDGYVRNPAYVTLYFLQVLLGIPVSLIDTASFDVMATYYEAIGEHKSGRFILQEPFDSMETLRQLLFSFGMKAYVAMGGKIKVERKDINNYATNTYVFDQIDLMRSPIKEFNIPNAISTVKVQYNYIPWSRTFLGAGEEERENYYGGGSKEDELRIERGFMD